MNFRNMSFYEIQEYFSSHRSERFLADELLTLIRVYEDFTSNKICSEFIHDFKFKTTRGFYVGFQVDREKFAYVCLGLKTGDLKIINLEVYSEVIDFFDALYQRSVPWP